MVAYFKDAQPADAAWAVHFLSGERPKRLIPVRRLAAWATEASDVPEWLFEQCYEAVGDLAETISLLLPGPATPGERAQDARMEEYPLPFGEMEEHEQRAAILAAWRSLAGFERFVWNKLITGGFRVGVSQPLGIRALSRVSGLSEGVIAPRLTGNWAPHADSWTTLVAEQTADTDVSRPYPFYLAYALEEELETLGEPQEWQVEWKWDGIRAQLVRRADRCYLWSRGEELVTERFPEIATAARLLPDGTVIDGEIMPWKEGKPLAFSQLQRRIGRKTLGTKILEEVPAVLIAYDVLEIAGEDVRDRPLAWRRERLAELLATPGVSRTLMLSPAVDAAAWDAVRAAWRRAREECAEGLMLKRLPPPRGGWWGGGGGGGVGGG